MATVDDVATLLTGVADYDTAISTVTTAGLSVTGDSTDGGGLLISATISAQRIGGVVTIVKPFWLLYDTTDPDKTKVKVPAGGAS